MFTDLLHLPINSERLTRQDQILTLSGMNWNDYEQLTQANSHYLLSYLEGVITIVSPSRSHEAIERTISILINFINRGLTESPLTIEADFISQLNC